MSLGTLSLFRNETVVVSLLQRDIFDDMRVETSVICGKMESAYLVSRVKDKNR